MNLPAGYDLGVATSTGLTRSANEDDFLVVALPGEGDWLLVAIADGMGGAAGGADASRASLRGLAAALQDSAAAEATARLEAGFRSAAARVRELARETPSLRDMGTTLTAVLLRDGEGALAHIGDTRALRCRGGALHALTVDHALREPQNYLTRCIGAGQTAETPDLSELFLQPRDRLLLVTDGVWGTVDASGLERALALASPQAAAEALVLAALRAGGPDNATALVLDRRPELPPRKLELPGAEVTLTAGVRWVGPRLRGVAWPWLLLVVSLVVAVLALLRWTGEFDLIAWWRSQAD